jgi:hypothetical protein
MDMPKDIKSTAKVTIFLALISLRDHDGKILFETLRNLLWNIDRGFAQSCFAGMLKYAKMFRKERVFYLHNEESSEREEEFYKKVLKLAVSVSREKVKINISDLSFKGYSPWYLGLAAQLIPFETEDGLYRSYIETLFMLTYEGLNTSDDNQNYYSDYVNTEFLLRDYLAEFLLHQDKSYSERLFSSILEQVFNTTERIDHRAQEFIEKIIKNLVVEEDKINVPVFWDLLAVLENKIKETHKPIFVQYLFLSIPWWNGDADDWPPLKNKKQYCRNLIISLGQYDIKSVIRLLSGIGTKCLLPDGIVWLDTIFSSSPESIQELSDSDTFFYSEKLIQRVYNLYLRDVKSNNEVKRSFLFFLDKMINAGSSLAFIVRERVVSI